MKRSRARSRKTEEGDGGGEHEEGEDKVDEEEEREGGGAPPAKKAKRARTVVDYEAIVRDDARHVRGVWAETTAQLSQAKGGSASVRVEVEKSLAAFLPRLVRHLRERDVDPAVDARAAQDRRQRELADEEARLAADVLELERQLEDLTSVNLGQRDDLRALAVPSPCDLQQQDQALLLLLSSLPPRASSQGDGEEQEEGTSLGGLRNDVDAAFARFIESATKLDEETAGTEREAKLARLLAVWKQRKNAGSADQPTDGQDTDDATRARLIASFKS